MKQSVNLTVLEPPLEPSVAPLAAQETPQAPLTVMNWNFVLLWQGQFISQLGGQIYSIMMVFWLKHATDSASILSLLAILNSMPSILLSGLGGVMADRYARRRILLISDLVRGVLVLSIVGLLSIMPDATTTLVVWFVIVSVGTTVAGTLSQPAMLAAYPDLVPQDKVARANSLRDLTGQLAVFLGQGLGGMLYILLGAPIVALVNGLTFLIAAATKWAVAIPQQVSAPTNSWQEEFIGVKREIVVGFRYSWDKAGLRALFTTSVLLNIFITPILILLPFYVEDFLQAPLEWYGYMLAVYGIGIVLGSLGAGYTKLRAQRRGWTIILFVFLIALGAIAMGFIHNPFAAAFVALVVGAMNSFNSVNVFSLIQLSTPSEMRGRVLGFFSTLSATAATLGLGVGGVFYDLSGQNIPLIFSSCGVMISVVMAVAVLNREFRQFLAYEPART